MRTKIVLLTLSIIIFNPFHSLCAGSSTAEDSASLPAVDVENKKTTADLSGGTQDSLKNGSFILETDEQSASESLDRISGNIDMGFSAPENSYKSEEHAGAGPFEKEKSELRKQNNSAY